MRITYFIRDPREGNFSLEKIFHEIGQLLSDKHEIKFYYVNSSHSKYWNIREAIRYQGDINHITGDVNWLAFGLEKKKTLLTAHDIGHYVNSLKGIKKVAYGILWWQWPIKKVALLTSVSEFTKRELVKYFKVSPEKILVIHNPLGKNFTRVSKKFNKLNPSILQVGSMSNKNVENLIIALKGISCTLHLLRKMDKRLENMLSDLKINFQFHENLTEEEVMDLYAEMDIVYLASTYEGFGLPIIEAQAIGRPVLTSNICSMPEIAGKGACFVNPLSANEIRESILKIIGHKDYREEIVNQGFENVKRFEAKKIADQYLSLYRELINN